MTRDAFALERALIATLLIVVQQRLLFDGAGIGADVDRRPGTALIPSAAERLLFGKRPRLVTR